jgi:hypothetical protein
MKNKQTAVDWLVEQILVKFEDHMNDDYEIDYSKPPTLKFYNAFIDSTDLSEYVNKAKQMEKEQIKDAWDKGDYCIDLPDGSWKQKYESGEQYYNETYGK